jgi:hypothetical protein
MGGIRPRIIMIVMICYDFKEEDSLLGKKIIKSS